MKCFQVGEQIEPGNPFFLAAHHGTEYASVQRMSHLGPNNIIPPDSHLDRVAELYQRGLSVDAFRLAESFAPLRHWSGVRARALGGRILANVGAPRLSARLIAKSWRANRANVAAQEEYCFLVLEKRGPFVAWQFMNDMPEGRKGTEEARAHTSAIRARIATDLRNFPAAEKYLQRAESIGPKLPWVRLQRAHLLEGMERIEEALEVARAACQLHKHPFYRPGVQVCAYYLQLLDRKEEAMELLERAEKTLQNSHVCTQLFVLYTETGRWADASAQLDLYEELSPAIEPDLRKWLTGQRARVAYFRNDRATAIHFASQLDDDFHKRFADHLKSPAPDVERVSLEVPFVRQHFKTCAPATLAALGRFWKMPADQLVIVEAVCYDGTPTWQQRKWAEENGWIAREFTVTWDAAVALLSAGIPFAITTSEATSGHMQTVMGFDRTRGTLLIRDPSQPASLEAGAKSFLERYAAYGPPGIVFMPKAEAARLNGIELPETELHDIDYQMSLALSRHARDEAICAIKQMETLAPDHRLTWDARLQLAYYDSNVTEQARCLDRLLAMFPNAAARLLQRLNCMRDKAREERLEFLLKACADSKADPALFVHLARLYLYDGRSRSKAPDWIRRALRARPLDSAVIGLIAEYLWFEGKLELATEHYRIAADLEGFRDNLYQSWFIACQRVRKANDALEVLRERFDRFGARSEQPALTLAWALDELEHPTKARDILRKAMELRTDDSYLRLRAARQYARVNDNEGARALLDSVRGKVRENDWLRAAAQVAEWQLDTAGALQIARDLLAIEPLAMDARTAVARCTLQLNGPEAALAEVQKACDEFPHHCELRRLLVQYSSRAGADKVIATARAYLQMASSDAWALRELAIALSQSNRFDEALVEARKAEAIEPHMSASYGILAEVHARKGDIAEAIKLNRRALELSVDYTHGIHELMGLVNTDVERKAQLAFIERELIRQVVTGEGLLAYIEVARPLVSSAELLNLVRRAHAERADLWQAWSALISELIRLGHNDEALKIAREATERFAHFPAAWLDLARVYGRLNNAPNEIAAAEHAFEMNPGWTRCALALAYSLARHRSLDDAKKIYQRALHHSPLDAQLHAELATVLWRQQQIEPAFAELERALRIAPGMDYAWDRLLDWARNVNQPDRASKLAAAIASERPGEMRNWLILAQMLPGQWDRPERLQALDRALALSPASFDVYDYKIDLFARNGQYKQALALADEALAVVKIDRHALEARRAWVLAIEGKTSEAISAMRKVLDENEGYSWGWHQLISWLSDQGAWVDAEDAIHKLLRINPRDGWALRHLGHLQAEKDDIAAAIKTFKTALSIDLTDDYSADRLFSLQVDERDFTGAAETLALMKIHQPGGQTVANEIILRLRKEEFRESLELFEKLCKTPGPDATPIDAAFKALKKNSRMTRGLRIMKRVLRTQGCNLRLGVVLMNHYIANLQWYRAGYQLKRIADPEVRKYAANVLADAVGKNTHWIVLRNLAWYCRDVFRSSDRAWGHIGYGFTRWQNHSLTSGWLSDWDKRTEVEPWMLFNLCLALRAAGDYDKCIKVSNYVLEKWPHHDDSGDVRVFLALELALRSQVDEAARHLAKAAVRDGVDYDKQLLLMAKTLITFLQCPEDERITASWVACQSLRGVSWTWFQSFNPGDIRRTFKRVAKRISQNGAGMRAKFWLFRRLNWPWLGPVVLLIYILIIWASRTAK
jgi:cellulose synthase operon protein C